MKTLTDFAETFTILAKYEVGNYNVCAEPDVIHIHVDPNIVSSEDRIKLTDLHVVPFDKDEEYRIYV